MSALILTELEQDTHAESGEERLRRNLQRFLGRPIVAMMKVEGYWYARFAWSEQPGAGDWQRVNQMLHDLAGRE